VFLFRFLFKGIIFVLVLTVIFNVFFYGVIFYEFLPHLDECLDFSFKSWISGEYKNYTDEEISQMFHLPEEIKRKIIDNSTNKIFSVLGVDPVHY
jgi:hypothetical protein